MSVLYVSHGHPAFAKGGGELAAWRLFQAFRAQPGFEASGFLAAASSASQLQPGCEVLGINANEWLVKASSNPVTHVSSVNLSEGSQLHEALRGRDFQLIHLHHYLHVGIDLVLALKRWFPQAKVVMTLHDYWGPCVLEGRLLKRSGEWCNGGDPLNCDLCLGGGRRAELAIRKLRLQRLVAAVDHFLSPSYFLKQRYLDWGLDPKRISVVENLPADGAFHSSSQLRSQHGSLVVGFFGQVNPWKGVNLLMDAVHLVRDRGVDVQLEVNGGESRAASEGVRFNGPYEPHQLAERMAPVDVVAMASIWYENSPMVIQEAFLHGRPVLAPRLGGMAEKIDHEKTGLLFAPNHVEALASELQRLGSDLQLLNRLKQNVQRCPLPGERAVQQHQAIYQRLLTSGGSSQLRESLPPVGRAFLNDLACHFEPLGANCELGYLMGRLGIQRSSLFRWLFTPLASLELVLQERLAHVFSDPVPVANPVMAADMVMDQRTGLYFHAAALRAELDAAGDDPALLENVRTGDAFLDQKAKYLYLVDKFLATLCDPATVHVFSDFHQELSEPVMRRIHQHLQNLGKPKGSSLLFVRRAGVDDDVNGVVHYGDGLQLATIRRLAPGDQADQIDLSAWLAVLANSRRQL